MGVDIGHLTIDAICDFDRRGVTLEEEIEVPFEALTLKVVSDGGACDEELQAVAVEVAKFCPLSKLFENGGTALTVTWSKA